jgi:hypothetical protein
VDIEPGFAALMADDLRTGQHRDPGRDPRFFTTSYFHDRQAMEAEVAEAGLGLADLLPVEGPLLWAASGTAWPAPSSAG